MRLVLFILLLTSFRLNGQGLYFPPSGTSWASIPTDSLGWCQSEIDELYTYLEQTNSKAFILLVDGKIVLEKYFGSFTQDSLWVWNSAGKTLTAVAVGIAQQKGYLSLSDSSSKFLGSGWTSLTAAQEGKITIKHQLTMTSGLGYTGGDGYCTDPNCLIYVSDPDVRWSYHNPPYTLLDGVIENATGQNLNTFVQSEIRSKIGMNGLFYKIGYNNIHLSTARSAARFGLFLLAQGAWNGTQILDPAYFQSMISSSQTMNPSYGYLTWLNGKSSSMLPSPDIQFSIPGKLLPNAPDDVFAALGKNGQFINVSPGQKLVFVRMGDSDGNSLVPTQYCDTIWQKINLLSCSSGLSDVDPGSIYLYPNPAHDKVYLKGVSGSGKMRLLNTLGEVVFEHDFADVIDLGALPSGFYFSEIITDAELIFRSEFIKL